MFDVMLGTVIFPKYLDPSISAVYVHIDGVIVPNNRIDLRATINVMTRETMLKLNLQGTLRKTTMIPQLADQSRVTIEGIVDDVMVSIYSCEYCIYFLVL